MARPRSPIAATCAFLLLGGCDDSGGPSACDTAAEPAVVLELTDAATQQPVGGATIILSEGATYSETMFEFPSGTYRGGAERPGTYDLAISAAGYDPQTISGVTAPAGTCGPITQMLQVALQPTTDLPVLLLVDHGLGEVTVRAGVLQLRER